MGRRRPRGETPRGRRRELAGDDPGAGVDVLRHLLALHRRVERRDAERADLRRMLRDRRALGACLDGVELVRQAVEADQDDPARLDAGVLDRLDRAERGRPARGVDRRQVRVRGQHRLRGRGALRLVAVGLELRDDLDLAT